ncbi:MAG: hypothetical protein ACKODH_17310 [Limisphaerales bacterium]
MRTRNLFLIFGLCLLMLLGLGWLDYVTGYELNLFVFYSLPVGIAAWYLGLWPGVAMSVASALTWWAADRSAGQTYSSNFVLYWNSAVHVGCFLINAFSIAKTRETIDRQRQLEAEVARLKGAAQTSDDQPGGGK